MECSCKKGEILTLEKIIADSILKLSEHIKDYPFLIFAVIAMFCFTFIVIVIYLCVQNLFIVTFTLLLLFFLMVYCGHLESKAKDNEFQKTKERMRKWK